MLYFHLFELVSLVHFLEEFIAYLAHNQRFLIYLLTENAILIIFRIRTFIAWRIDFTILLGYLPFNFVHFFLDPLFDTIFHKILHWSFYKLLAKHKWSTFHFVTLPLVLIFFLYKNACAFFKISDVRMSWVNSVFHLLTLPYFTILNCHSAL